MAGVSWYMKECRCAMSGVPSALSSSVSRSAALRLQIECAAARNRASTGWSASKRTRSMKKRSCRLGRFSGWRMEKTMTSCPRERSSASHSKR